MDRVLLCLILLFAVSMALPLLMVGIGPLTAHEGLQIMEITTLPVGVLLAFAVGATFAQRP